MNIRGVSMTENALLAGIVSLAIVNGSDGIVKAITQDPIPALQQIASNQMSVADFQSLGFVDINQDGLINSEDLGILPMAALNIKRIAAKM